MKIIIKTCLNCSTDFEASLKEHNRGNAHFCTGKCSSIYRSKNLKPKEHNCTCATCSKTFYRNDSKKSNSKSSIYFCSRFCKDQGQRIGGIKEIMPSHYGEGKYQRYCHLAFSLLEHKCNRCPYDEYKEVLQVHHKDRNRSNNSIDNLEILCPTCHCVEHFLAKDGAWTPN